MPRKTTYIGMANDFGLYIEDGQKVYDDEIPRPDLNFCRSRGKHCDLEVSAHAADAYRRLAERLNSA